MSADIPLVSTDWLQRNLTAPELRMADASWYMPSAARDAHAEYEKQHIPGAVFFDIEAISDKNTGLPHMLPDASAFASAMRKIGIGNAHTVVLYDSSGIFSSPRAWWMLRAMGHRDAAVLDGGLPKWLRERRPVNNAPPEIRPSHFNAEPDPGILRNYQQILANLATLDEQVVDARSSARFHGLEPEPRPGLASGHIPASRNMPYADVLMPDGTMRDPSALRRLFTARGIDLERPVVTSCGSGITAAIVLLALEIAGASHTALYDGSWAEWGSRPGAPIELG